MEQISQDKNPLVEHIEKEMKARGWSQAELSRKSGVSTASISRFLDGSINIKVINIYRLLASLDLIKLDRDITKEHSGEGMTYTPEDISNLIKLALGYQMDIQKLSGKVDELTKEILQLRTQCQSTQTSLGKVNSEVKKLGLTGTDDQSPK